MASRSSANCGKSMCACESISSISEMCRVRAPPHGKYLLQAGADFDVFVGEAGEDGAAFGADGSGDDHAVGFDAAKFARREIDDDGDFAADQFLRLVELGHTASTLANFVADIDVQLQQFVLASDAFGGLDPARPPLHFC